MFGTWLLRELIAFLFVEEIETFSQCSPLLHQHLTRLLAHTSKVTLRCHSTLRTLQDLMFLKDHTTRLALLHCHNYRLWPMSGVDNFIACQIKQLYERNKSTFCYLQSSALKHNIHSILLPCMKSDLFSISQVPRFSLLAKDAPNLETWKKRLNDFIMDLSSFYPEDVNWQDMVVGGGHIGHTGYAINVENAQAFLKQRDSLTGITALHQSEPFLPTPLTYAQFPDLQYLHLTFPLAEETSCLALLSNEIPHLMALFLKIESSSWPVLKTCKIPTYCFPNLVLFILNCPQPTTMPCFRFSLPKVQLLDCDCAFLLPGYLPTVTSLVSHPSNYYDLDFSFTFPALKKLTLKLHDGYWLIALDSFPNLMNLEIHGEGITMDSLVKLPSLKILLLSKASISVLSCFETPVLERLVIKQINISDHRFSFLWKDRPKLSSLVIEFLNVTAGLGVNQVEMKTSLNDIRIVNGRMSFEFILFLLQLPMLSFVELSTRLTNPFHVFHALKSHNHYKALGHFGSVKEYQFCLISLMHSHHIDCFRNDMNNILENHVRSRRSRRKFFLKFWLLCLLLFWIGACYIFLRR